MEPYKKILTTKESLIISVRNAITLFSSTLSMRAKGTVKMPRRETGARVLRGEASKIGENALHAAKKMTGTLFIALDVGRFF